MRLYRMCGLVSFLFLAGTGPPLLRAQTFDPAREYRNPVLFADYSDPDVLRDGQDYYLVASTFHFVPGLVILHSRDLAHWSILGHAIAKLKMAPEYDLTGKMRYGRGVWAPALRFHNGLFYIYFPTPDEGIFVTTAPRMTGPWSEPETVLAGPGLEDPCPFWDDDGQEYLVHSRTGAGPLILHRMSADGKHLLDEGKVIVQDREHLPTLEGPKVYKRNGWYYIFAPKGGVAVGDQVALRSRSIDGPYDFRVVLARGNTNVNGPHQGGWVETPDGKGWFLHFQERGAHGRIVWLEPVRWEDDWPVMGAAPPGATTGEPVMTGTLPVLHAAPESLRPQTSDDFSSSTLAPMWEWNHNPVDSAWSLKERPGFLRLHPGFAEDLMHARNTLTETMQDESLQVTTRVDVSRMMDGDHAGLSAFERSLSAIGVVQKDGRRSMYFSSAGKEIAGPEIAAKTSTVDLRLQVAVNTATYSYSMDGGKTFQPLGTPVQMVFSWWKGARPALFAYNTVAEGKGFVDFDWVHYAAPPTAKGTAAR